VNSNFVSASAGIPAFHRSGILSYPSMTPRMPAALEGLQSESCPARVEISSVLAKSPSP